MASRKHHPRHEYELWLCDDCTIAEVNGDYSGMSDERAEEVAQGIEQLVARVGHISANWDSETEEGIRDFSSRPCDSCGTHLAGSRHRFAAFGRSGLGRARRPSATGVHEIASRRTITKEVIEIKWAGGEARIEAYEGWQITVRYNSRGERAALRVEALLRSIPGSENRGGRTDFWYWWGTPMPPDMPERIDAAAMSSARRSR